MTSSEDIVENLITFNSQKPWLNETSNSTPSTTQKTIPQWYKDADRFAKNTNTGEYYQATKEICPVAKEGTESDYGKVPTWKACPGIMDGFLTGYVLKTPCDLKFFKNSNGIIDVKISDARYKDFCTQRSPMPQFEHPVGYDKNHFAWYSDWGLSLPEGYSALFITPMNRFDLPFLNTTGIIDCDKVNLLGTFPFFVIDGWEGILKAGTPYMQVIPFKRENWSHKINITNIKDIYSNFKKNIDLYRQPDGGIYKNQVWSKREYR
jgi:hypothetical protein